MDDREALGEERHRAFDGGKNDGANTEGGQQRLKGKSSVESHWEIKGERRAKGKKMVLPKGGQKKKKMVAGLMKRADPRAREEGFGNGIRDFSWFEVGSNSGAPETSREMRGWEIDSECLVAQVASE